MPRFYPPASEIIGGGKDEKLLGGIGDDTLNAKGGDDGVLGGLGDDLVIGGGGNDRLSGGAGHDVLEGGLGNDWLAGGVGDDTLRGGQGEDLLWAGSGSDSLNGGDGDDRLAGGQGSDTLKGGLGADDFFIMNDDAGEDVVARGITVQNYDVLLDFDPNEGDQLSLSGFDVAGITGAVDTSAELRALVDASAFAPVASSNGNTVTIYIEDSGESLHAIELRGYALDDFGL